METSEGRCIVLVPHADDELIGVNSLIISRKNVLLIYFEFLGSNYTEYNRNIRLKEFMNYCKTVNCQYDLFEGVGLNTIDEKDTVFLPSIVDWNEEHRKINYLLREYCHSKCITPNIVWYNISVYSSYKGNAKYLPQTRSIYIKKYNMLKKLYPSQRRLPVLRYKIKDRLYGNEIGEYAAEKYICLSYMQWENAIENFDKLHLDDSVSTMREKLDNLTTVSEIANKIYEMILGE